MKRYNRGDIVCESIGAEATQSGMLPGTWEKITRLSGKKNAIRLRFWRQSDAFIT